MRKTTKKIFYLFFIFTFFTLSGKSVLAHPLSPSLWQWVETSPGQISMSWQTSIAKISGEEFYPSWPEGCQKISESEPSRVRKYWVKRLELKCEATWASGLFKIEGIKTARSNIILKITLADGRNFQHILNASSPTFVIPEREAKISIFKTYLNLGFHHILTGWDHLLFVLGLFLLIKPGRALVLAITSFTLAHSITLSLAVLKIIPIPSEIVEVFIALSILILAYELLRDQSVKPTFFHLYPWAMSFTFGLLHGMGFAGALSEVGLPQGDIPLALVSFNAGIEAGQLCFIIVLWALWKIIQKIPLPSFLKHIQIPAYVIGSLAAFWFFERLSEVGLK